MKYNIKRKLQKRSHSLYLLIPHVFVEVLGLTPDSEVNVEIRNENIVITPIKKAAEGVYIECQ